MSYYVNDGGHLVPRFVVEPINPPTGVCQRCGGIGQVPETWDEERHDVMVACKDCHPFCKTCGGNRRRGHVCGAKEMKRLGTVRPCPICGSSNLGLASQPVGGKDSFRVFCKDCRQTTGRTPVEAVEQWNGRAEGR